MKNIILQKRQSKLTDKKIFIVKSGKIITRDILETGKVITNESYLTAGELVCNFSKFLLLQDFKVPEIEVEIVAMENNTILEELNVTVDELMGNSYSQKIICSLLKKVSLKLFYQLYDTKGYVLAVLKLYRERKKFIYKADIHYENFNISKSQFYLIYRNLKKESFLTEVNDKVYLNSKKIDWYLKKHKNL